MEEILSAHHRRHRTRSENGDISKFLNCCEIGDFGGISKYEFVKPEKETNEHEKLLKYVLNLFFIKLLFLFIIKNNCFIIRKLLLSAKESYTVFSATEYFINGEKIKIVSKTAQTNSNRMIYNTKLLNKNEKNKNLDYFSIATYENAYKANQGYFEKIIKSYKN